LGPKARADLVVRSLAVPRRSQTAPLEAFSAVEAAARSRWPSPLTSRRAVVAPNSSFSSATPGTPAVFWWKTWAPAPVRPEALPWSRATEPASVMLPTS
jgi:hypothetical protein